LQLAYEGAEDVYLTGQPQITFYKRVYLRHTPFAIESIQVTKQFGRADFAQSVIFDIDERAGDLLKQLWLEVVLDNDMPLPCHRLGYQLIDELELIIASQTIETISKAWLDVYAQLSLSSESLMKLYRMLQGYPSPEGGFKIIIPLPFWFSLSPALALSLKTLYHSKVQLKITFSTLLICTAPERPNDIIGSPLPVGGPRPPPPRGTLGTQLALEPGQSIPIAAFQDQLAPSPVRTAGSYSWRASAPQVGDPIREGDAPMREYVCDVDLGLLEVDAGGRILVTEEMLAALQLFVDNNETIPGQNRWVIPVQLYVLNFVVVNLDSQVMNMLRNGLQMPEGGPNAQVERAAILAARDAVLSAVQIPLVFRSVLSEFWAAYMLNSLFDGSAGTKTYAERSPNTSIFYTAPQVLMSYIQASPLNIVAGINRYTAEYVSGIQDNTAERRLANFLGQIVFAYSTEPLEIILSALDAMPRITNPFLQQIEQVLFTESVSIIVPSMPRMTSIRLWADYVFLGLDDERRAFVLPNPQSHLMPTITYQSRQMVFSNTGAPCNIPIELGGLCKAFILLVQSVDTLLTDTNTDDGTLRHPFDYFASAGTEEDSVSTLQLFLDGAPFAEAHDGSYFRCVTPSYCVPGAVHQGANNTRGPMGGFYFYPFALYPCNVQPSGHLSLHSPINRKAFFSMTLSPRAPAQVLVTLFTMCINEFVILNGIGFPRWCP
jgi:hypothetical protein